MAPFRPVQVWLRAILQGWLAQEPLRAVPEAGFRRYRAADKGFLSYFSGQDDAAGLERHFHSFCTAVLTCPEPVAPGDQHRRFPLVVSPPTANPIPSRALGGSEFHSICENALNMRSIVACCLMIASGPTAPRSMAHVVKAPQSDPMNSRRAPWRIWSTSTLLSLFHDAVYRTINVRLVAIEQVPELFVFRGYWTSIW